MSGDMSGDEQTKDYELRGTIRPEEFRPRGLEALKQQVDEATASIPRIEGAEDLIELDANFRDALKNLTMSNRVGVCITLLNSGGFKPDQWGAAVIDTLRDLQSELVEFKMKAGENNVLAERAKARLEKHLEAMKDIRAVTGAPDSMPIYEIVGWLMKSIESQRSQIHRMMAARLNPLNTIDVLLSLSANNVPVDIQKLLVRGDKSKGIPPNALMLAISAGTQAMADAMLVDAMLVDAGAKACNLPDSNPPDSRQEGESRVGPIPPIWGGPGAAAIGKFPPPPPPPPPSQTAPNRRHAPRTTLGNGIRTDG